MTKFLKTIPFGEPICLSCSHCIGIEKVTRRRYDLDCEVNPNLGGVTFNFCKCKSYSKKKTTD